MKSLKPIQLVVFGSLGIACVSLISLIFLGNINFNVSLLISLIIGTLTYVLFYFLIRHFITQRIKILYRSIRKGKFDNGQIGRFKLSEDVIETAEIETKKWSDERTKEITQLKAQEEFRREFLGNLAHELKTPVFSVQGYILTLLDGGLEDESINRNFLERASKATDRMTSILEDLDQLTKMEVNKIHLDKSIFDIVLLTQDLFEDLEIQAKKKKIKLKFSREFNPLFVNADRNKIAQVLTNLIRNSISYGHEGGETIVRFYSLDDILTVEVSDDGPGIEEIHLPRLFERFYRVEKSRNRNEGGTGLGLAIVKHIMEAHGQTISVRSTPDVGSTFTFGLDKSKPSARRN